MVLVWIGSAVVPELISAGHQVLGLARSDSAAKAVADMGAEVLRGDLNDIDVLHAGTVESDGVIHLAFVVPSVSEAATRTDARAIRTFVAGLADTGVAGRAGSGKPLVVSGATLVIPGRPATERDELIAAGPIAARITNMQAALAAADQGVRSCLVMLPRSVHGQGERHGFIPQLIAAARRDSRTLRFRMPGGRARMHGGGRAHGQTSCRRLGGRSPVAQACLPVSPSRAGGGACLDATVGYPQRPGCAAPGWCQSRYSSLRLLLFHIVIFFIF